MLVLESYYTVKITLDAGKKFERERERDISVSKKQTILPIHKADFFSS